MAVAPVQAPTIPHVNPGQVSAVIPTRGDVDLTEIRARLPFDDVVVYDNSVEADVSVFGRYAALERCHHPVVYVQDDDCLIDPDAIAVLLAAYRPGEIMCNMPESRWEDYPDSCLVGWGAVFDRWLPHEAFYRYARRFSIVDREFMDTCDVVFTTLTPHRKLDLGFAHLPWAETAGRMFKQPEHIPTRTRTLQRAREIRDA